MNRAQSHLRAMGVVYRAHDATLGPDVAIKLLRAEAGQHPERVRRFSQEARAASALNHPNIVVPVAPGPGGRWIPKRFHLHNIIPPGGIL